MRQMAIRYYSAQEAAQILNVSKQTIYAYVSRGLIQSEEGEGRSRLYVASDVDALARRKVHKRDPSEATREALDWGLPVLDSALSTIVEGRLLYRGKDVEVLMGQERFERVARWLWAHTLEGEEGSWLKTWKRKQLESVLQRVEGLGLLARLQGSLIWMEQEDWGAFQTNAASVEGVGRRILHMWTAVYVGVEGARKGRVAQALARRFEEDMDRELVERWITMALVGCADHELNASTFTARCVASTGATPYGAVQAGMATLLGRKHGGNVYRVGAMFDEVMRASSVREGVLQRMRRGEKVPGFRHRLYVEGGDPRARVLLAELRKTHGGEELLRRAEELEELMLEMEEGAYATVDYALVLLARMLGEGEEFALYLFAMGRVVGWLAHVIEQYETEQLIRPRARYTGPVEDVYVSSPSQ